MKANRLGDVCAEAGFKLESDPDTVLGPDVSFVAQDRVGLVRRVITQVRLILPLKCYLQATEEVKVEHKLSAVVGVGRKISVASESSTANS